MLLGIYLIAHRTFTAVLFFIRLFPGGVAMGLQLGQLYRALGIAGLAGLVLVAHFSACGVFCHLATVPVMTYRFRLTALAAGMLMVVIIHFLPAAIAMRAACLNALGAGINGFGVAGIGLVIAYGALPVLFMGVGSFKRSVVIMGVVRGIIGRAKPICIPAVI